MTIKPWVPLPNTPPLSMTEIEAEFGGQALAGIALNEYYAGGAYVPPGTIGYPNGVATAVPSNGQISVANFYGSQRAFSTEFRGNSMNVAELAAGTWYVYTTMVGAGGGAGGSDRLAGGNGGVGGSLQAKFIINSNTPQTIVAAAGTGGGGGPSGIPARIGTSPGRTWAPASRTVGGGVGPADYGSWNHVAWITTEWHPFLRDHGIWNFAFPTGGFVESSPRYPVSVFFPSSGNYTFQGCADEQLLLYIGDNPVLFANFSGFTNLSTSSIYLDAGWHTIWFQAASSGGQYGLALRISDPVGNTIFDTLDFVAGGRGSGGYWFLNGGGGGGAGFAGTSAAGGGGGSGTGLMWYPNGNYKTSSNYKILAVAPGGGGGGGGAYSGPITKVANWRNRGYTTNINTAITSPPQTDTSVWNSAPQGQRMPYPINNNYLHGQGSNNHISWFPPQAAYKFEVYDGSGSGGGGAPWGLGSGMPEYSNRIWYILQTIDKNGVITDSGWIPPNEVSGAGGSQGFIYADSATLSTIDYSSTNSLYPAYGQIGLGGTGNGLQGRPGGYAVRISNIDDGIWPSRDL